MSCPSCRSDEFLMWEESGALWASCGKPWIEEILNIINFEGLPFEEYKNNLDFQSKEDMIRGYFTGVIKVLIEMTQIINEFNGEEQIDDIEEVSPRLKKLLLDNKIMIPLEWEKVATFIYETSDDSESTYVIYQDSKCKELGRELVDNLIRKKIEYNTVHGGKTGDKNE